MPITRYNIDGPAVKLSKGNYVLYRDHLKIVRALEDKIRRLDGKITNSSWATNPDRMGGQFTQEEIERSRYGNW